MDSLKTPPEVRKAIKHYSSLARTSKSNQSHFALGYVQGATSHWEAILHAFGHLESCVEDFDWATEPKANAPHLQSSKSPRTIAKHARAAQKAAVQVCEVIGAPVTAQRVVALSTCTGVIIPKNGDFILISRAEQSGSRLELINRYGQIVCVKGEYEDEHSDHPRDWKYGLVLTIKFDDGETVSGVKVPRLLSK